MTSFPNTLAQRTQFSEVSTQKTHLVDWSSIITHRTLVAVSELFWYRIPIALLPVQPSRHFPPCSGVPRTVGVFRMCCPPETALYEVGDLRRPKGTLYQWTSRVDFIGAPPPLGEHTPTQDRPDPLTSLDTTSETGPQRSPLHAFPSGQLLAPIFFIGPSRFPPFSQLFEVGHVGFD